MHGNAFNQYWQLEGKDTSHLELSTSKIKDMLITAENIQVKPNLRSLYAYLKENHFIEAIHGQDDKLFDIFSRDILKKIKDGEKDWEASLPDSVADIIKKRKLFGYKG